jgi:sirohydrochlorin ferrochelatase
MAATGSADPRIHMCPPIGLHDAMAGLIERQALAACATLGIPSRSAAVLVAGHGSASAPGRTLALHEHTARAGWTGLFARVESACLEEAPFVAEALQALRAHPVVVIGFFAGDGGHVRDDMPSLVSAEQAARGADGPVVHLTGSVTDDPAMPQIILDQAAS